MDDSLALTIDVGTQSLRTMIIDKKGRIVASSVFKYDTPYFSLKKGWAEQNPDYWFDGLCQCTKDLMTKIDENQKQKLLGLTISTMRDTFIYLDEKKEVVRPCIMWLDQRVTTDDDKLSPLYEVLFRLVGMRETIDQSRNVTRALWIKKYEPENFKRIKHYISLGCYLNFKLTGNLIDATGNQAGHIPLDYKSLKYHKQGSMMYQATPVDVSWLPTIIQSGAKVGSISKQVSELTGLPHNLEVLAGGTDKCLETLGCGVCESNKASISFGTAASIEMAFDKYVEPQKFMPSYPSVIKHMWTPDVQIYRGFWMMRWFAQQFGQAEQIEAQKQNLPVEVLLDKLLEEAPAGSDGLVLQPYWFPGLKQIEAKGTIMGFSDYHTRAHLYRSIIEGVCFELYSGLKGIEKNGKARAQSICINGGGSKSDAACQIACDLFGLPAYRCSTTETSSLGAAILVFVAKKEFSSFKEACENMVHYERVFEPNMQNHKVYQDLYENCYKHMYKQVRPIYTKLFKAKHKS